MEKQFEAFDCLWGDCLPTDGTGGVKTQVVDPWQSPPFNPGAAVPQTTDKPPLLLGGPVRSTMIGARPNVINNYYQLPAAPSTVPPVPVAAIPANRKPVADNTIFGFSPLVVLGAAAAGLYFLSSMDGKK